MDNTPKPTDKGCGWVDMSCQMVMQYNDATIYRELGQAEKARAAESEGPGPLPPASIYGAGIENDGFYYDVNAKGEKFKEDRMRILAADRRRGLKEQASRLVEGTSKIPREFWRPFVFPTLAADEKEYNPKGGYWVGSVWAPTNYAIIKGLQRYGYDAFAAEASEKYLAAMADVFQKTGTVWENYAPESMSPGDPAAKDFVGWTACGPIALYIENVLGFRPDGVRDTLGWNLRLAEPHGINHFPLLTPITTDIAYDGKSTVTVKASAPFTLIINGRKFEVKKGGNNFANVEQIQQEKLSRERDSRHYPPANATGLPAGCLRLLLHKTTPPNLFFPIPAGSFAAMRGEKSERETRM